MSKIKHICIQINGGTGKNLAFASVLKEARPLYETIAVVSPYVDIFQASPYVDKVYDPRNIRSAIEDFEGDDSRYVIDHIYDESEFIYKKENYSDAFRRLLNIPSKHEEASSTHLELNTSVFPIVKQKVEEILNKHKQFLLVQFTGGQSPLVDARQGWQNIPYNGQNAGLSRHYPKKLADTFTQLFKQKYPDVDLILYHLPNEPMIDNTVRYEMPYMVYYELAKSEQCKGIICIDSSLQHLTSGSLKPTIVLWGHSLPQSFGYKGNVNIIQDCNRKSIHYFSQLGPSDNIIHYIRPEKLMEEVDKMLTNENKTEE